ncbi:hypothetical protein QFZ36_002660 [Pseudarthrobacter siccitolerans]|uniref:Uncharacterized protein n=1 Tax=Pseudarthrobacter siccitolerans TaxID=861266 RepID=A0ABU0PMB3_9MICC|nr:hypothetical protein [Pseudarthrobacter siccitolerans]MDQ0733366.1 hypothetical protein [Arthrobacter sp. B1I2]
MAASPDIPSTVYSYNRLPYVRSGQAAVETGLNYVKDFFWNSGRWYP